MLLNALLFAYEPFLSPLKVGKKNNAAADSGSVAAAPPKTKPAKGKGRAKVSHHTTLKSMQESSVG